MARSMKEVHTINYYPINEGAARRAKEMNSFSDYKEGSATAEYRAMVDKAAAIAEKQKSRVDPMYHEKIDHLLDTYARKLAENMNQGFAIDAKDISENWLGKATISMQTEGRNRGQSESYSQNMQRLGRELMTTSEITTMPGDKCILQLRGLPPFLSPKYDLKKHPNYKYTAEFDKKKNAFRLESLFRHRPLRLKPEDEYTVYEVDGSDTDEEADLLNFDDLDSDEFV